MSDSRHTICLVLGYDGSADAQDALNAAARLHPGSRTIVAHAWMPPLAPMPTPMSPSMPPAPAALDDTRYERLAREVVADGVDRASAAGLAAEPSLHRASEPAAVAAALIETAARHDADAIVVGRRGLGRVRTALLGSVSQEVLRSAACPVLVVTRSGNPDAGMQRPDA